MVDITNGINSMTVTKGAYEGIYKHQGYTLVHDYAVSSTVTPAKEIVVSDDNYIIENETPYSDNQEPPAEPLQMEELLEKPIGQWSKEEVKDFANANGISLEGTKSAKEAKEIIKSYIDSM